MYALVRPTRVKHTRNYFGSHFFLLASPVDSLTQALAGVNGRWPLSEKEFVRLRLSMALGVVESLADQNAGLQWRCVVSIAHDFGNIAQQGTCRLRPPVHVTHVALIPMRDQARKMAPPRAWTGREKLSHKSKTGQDRATIGARMYVWTLTPTLSRWEREPIRSRVLVPSPFGRGAG
jgi:hypothetical protein